MTDPLNKEEEQDLLDSFEKGEWQTSSHLKERKLALKAAARATIRKDKRVNIRISERDLRELKRLAMREGLPYQTLVSSILHKFVNGVPVTSSTGFGDQGSGARKVS